MDIIAKDLCKSFGNKTVLNGVSFRFEKGGSYCVTGTSGSGKTTLLNILLGILDADSGEISGTGGMRFSVVFQDDRLCDKLSAGANLKMVCKSQRFKTEAEGVLEALLLPNILKKPVRELSGGMRRRLCIARAVLFDGDAFVLDEPFKGLDESTKLSVMDYLQAVRRGRTMIWVTHELGEAEYMGSEITILRNR